MQGCAGKGADSSSAEVRSDPTPDQTGISVSADQAEERNYIFSQAQRNGCLNQSRHYTSKNATISRLSHNSRICQENCQNNQTHFYSRHSCIEH